MQLEFSQSKCDYIAIHTQQLGRIANTLEELPDFSNDVLRITFGESHKDITSTKGLRATLLPPELLANIEARNAVHRYDRSRISTASLEVLALSMWAARYFAAHYPTNQLSDQNKVCFTAATHTDAYFRDNETSEHGTIRIIELSGIAILDRVRLLRMNHTQDGIETKFGLYSVKNEIKDVVYEVEMSDLDIFEQIEALGLGALLHHIVTTTYVNGDVDNQAAVLLSGKPESEEAMRLLHELAARTRHRKQADLIALESDTRLPSKDKLDELETFLTEV